MSAPLPAPQPAPRGPAKVAIHGGGHDRFGALGGLQVYRDQTLGLARFLAGQFGLADVFEEGDPQVTVTATRYAMALKAEMDLASSQAKEVSERAAQTGRDYAQAFFDATCAESFVSANRDLDRQHRLTIQFRRELQELAEERRASDTASPATS